MLTMQRLFDDKRLLVALLGIWTILSAMMFGAIMLEDGSHFLSFGPNPETVLFGSKLDSWTKWWVVAVYTFVSTAIAAFSSAVQVWTLGLRSEISQVRMQVRAARSAAAAATAGSAVYVYFPSG